MARLEPYLAHPLAEAVGWALLHSLWQGALVALLFAGSLVLVRRQSPQLHYLLGCAALVLLVILSVGTGTLLYNPGIQPLVGLESQSQIEVSEGVPTPSDQGGADALTTSIQPASLPTPAVSLGAHVT